jgi:hypothetical protein
MNDEDQITAIRVKREEERQEMMELEKLKGVAEAGKNLGAMGDMGESNAA